MAPKTYLYVSRRADNGEVRVRLRALARKRRRFSYSRLHILLAREGQRLNHKKLFRLYRAERLGVRRRGGRKRALGTRAPMAVPQGKNQRWSLDFVSDALASGLRFRVLAVVDDFTRERLTLVTDTSLSGLRVGRELDRIVALRGRPAMIVSDNGTELTSHAMLRWQQGQLIFSTAPSSVIMTKRPHSSIHRLLPPLSLSALLQSEVQLIRLGPRPPTSRAQSR